MCTVQGVCVKFDGTIVCPGGSKSPLTAPQWALSPNPTGPVHVFFLFQWQQDENVALALQTDWTLTAPPLTSTANAHTHTPSLPSLNVTEKLLQPLLSRTLIPWLSFSKLHVSRLPVPVRLTSHASLHFLPYLSVCLSGISLSVKTLGFNTLPVCISMAKRSILIYCTSTTTFTTAQFQSPIRGAITVLLINLGVDFNGIISHPATSLALH